MRILRVTNITKEIIFLTPPKKKTDSKCQCLLLNHTSKFKSPILLKINVANTEYLGK